MKVEIVTDIESEPVTIDEVKAALRITGSYNDDDLEDMITDARVYVEKALDCSVKQKSLKVTNEIELEDWEMPFGPVVGDVTSSTNTDSQYIYEYTGGYDDDSHATPLIKRLILDIIKYWYDIDDLSADMPRSIKKKIQLLNRNP